MNVAIIAARGGSKRIPGKNIKIFIDKPMVSYSIRAAVESGLFGKVVVSTDSEAIANVARKYGAEVPFMRPAGLSDDHTPMGEAVQHALVWLKEHGTAIDYTCCILPTAPFIQAHYIKKGYDLIRENRVDAVFTVTTYSFPIFRSLRINKDGNLEMFWPEYELTRSNDLPEAYHDAGQFYWLNTDNFIKNKKFYTKDALPIILPRYLVQDIDTEEDWHRAELMYKVINV